jgi:hypothetical protein
MSVNVLRWCVQRGYSPDAMAARTQILWNAQKSAP